jgi:hypothetical protein
MKLFDIKSVKTPDVFIPADSFVKETDSNSLMVLGKGSIKSFSPD